MKYILLLVLAFVVLKAANENVLFSADYSKYATQFEPFQKFLGNANPTATAEVITEEGSQVLSFSKDPIKQFGVITTDWISSPSGNYYITVEFKGTLNKRTGGYIGYIREDGNNIQRTIGLDADYNMEFSQIFKFETTGIWSNYIAYLPFAEPGVKIKLILEKGSYFGNKDNNNAKFRNLKVVDFTFSENCQDTDQKQQQQSYSTFLFFNNKIQNSVFTTSTLENKANNKGTLKFNYPAFYPVCFLASFYGLNTAGKVIDKFAPIQVIPSKTLSTNQQNINYFEYTFTMNDIETLGCFQAATKDSQDRDSIKYTCDYQLHFYYNNGEAYASKQLQYDYTSANSQAIFKSQFSVIVYKETSTILSTLVKTLEITQICKGICQLNMALTLALQIKNATDTDYKVPSGTLTVVWGDYMKFKIVSTPADYKLELMQVVITTGTETVQLDQMFIDSFVQNMNKNTNGQLTFEMMISGEAGLDKGKPFNLQFLTKTTAATSRRLLDDITLPDAQISGEVAFNTTVTKSASQLTIGLLAILMLLMLF